MKWIKKILHIEPYVVTCLWNDNEIRKVDLGQFIADKSNNPNNSYTQLKDKKRFMEVKCDGSTLFWDNGILMKDFDGSEKYGPLDIDPHVLFELSYNDLKKNNKHQHAI